ncbi:RagB/SusD family nutrient uptake outer membrane protein [Mangrovimonas xylaniphaga]|uniref:RagB/SusD family nutrient uptake outer membrane protein n=1 Tax=Mangrovimonas xylaniphaga TaxID=1645915 RepID=UPI0006B46AF7|nr:RagB/SusD family nutrient uptake outer membrane protein [Mangrovimonas xylaniphaga]
MRKFYKISIALFAVTLFFTGCQDDFLDQDLRHTLSAEDAANTVNGNKALIASGLIYARSIFADGGAGISVFKPCGTDIVRSGTNLTDEPADGLLGMNTYDGNFSAASGPLDAMWNYYYSGVTPANIAISGIEASGPIEDLDPEIKDALGQAYTMRAYLYLELVRRFENIPIVEVADLEETGPVFTTEQNSKEEVYDLIISDLEAAIPLLKTRSEGDDQAISISKGLANMMLAEASLDIGDYTKAVAAAEAVINDGSYVLQPLDNIFGLDGGKGGEENNSELIFSIAFQESSSTVQWTSQMFVPLYDRIPGVARTMESGGRPWSRLSPSEYYWSLFDTDGDGDVMDEADGRVQAWHKLFWTFDDPENLPDGVEIGDVVLEEHAASTNVRYIEPTSTKTWENGQYNRTTALAEGWRNIIIFRLAHAYLDAAEAHFQLGNTGQAMQYLNVLRERAYGNTSGNFSNITFEDIIEEHARELGHEGHRWYFLKRNGLLIERTNMYNPNAAGNITAGKHERWPIPQSFIDQTGATQNPGY